MDKKNKNQIQIKKRRYGNVCLCKTCNNEFLFTEALARKISFGMTDKVCPECGSSDITFTRFSDNGIKHYVDKFKTCINN